MTSVAADFEAIAAALAAVAPVTPTADVMPAPSPSSMERWIGHQRRILADQGPALDAPEAHGRARAAAVAIRQAPEREGQRARVLRALRLHGPCTSGELAARAALEDRYLASRRLPELMAAALVGRRRRGREWEWAALVDRRECPGCGGDGLAAGVLEDVTCPRCEGAGWVARWPSVPR